MAGRILYIEAPDGISGDMTLGALIDLGIDIDAIRGELDKVIPGEYSLDPRPFERSGIHGTSLYVQTEGDVPSVLLSPTLRTEASSTSVSNVIASGEAAKQSHHHHHHHHHHRHYSDIKAMIEGSGITERAKAYSIAIFDVIADAEAHVHQIPVEKVAFHEVGALDSIIDIVGTAIAVDLLGVSEFYCSAPRDGSGTITCQHGLIPVPVPAVMKMAAGAGIPIVIESDVHTEMITPTGFGIIKGLGAKFEPHLGIVPEKTGYGFGKRDTGRFGAVRVTLGEKYEEAEGI